MTRQHGPLDTARIQLGQDRARVERETAGRLAAGSVTGPVERHDAQLGRQLVSELLPVRARARLAVQQDDLVSAHTGDFSFARRRASLPGDEGTGVSGPIVVPPGGYE